MSDKHSTENSRYSFFEEYQDFWATVGKIVFGIALGYILAQFLIG